MAEPLNSGQLRIAAMDYLARREHTAAELETKLRGRFRDNPEVEVLLPEVIQQLQRDGLQSDERFAEAFVRGRCAKGHGPLRIARDLRQKGLSSALIHHHLNSSEVDFFALAASVARKKFGPLPAADIKEQARRIRFLNYRGFTGEQASCALEAVATTI